MKRDALLDLLLLAIILLLTLPTGSEHDHFVFSSLMRIYIVAMLGFMLVIGLIVRKKRSDDQ